MSVVLCASLAAGVLAVLPEKSPDSQAAETTTGKGSKEYSATGIRSNKRYEIPDDSGGSNSRTWREGMVSGNGENGVIASCSPYTDTMIFQYMYFNYPSADPIEASEDEYT